MPKRVLWALLALELIAIGLQAAFALDSRRKRKLTPPPATQEPQAPQYFRFYSLYWDEDLNPRCPADETMLSYLRRHATDHYDILRCPRCRNEFMIHDDEEDDNLTLHQAKDEIRDKIRLA